MNFIVVVMISIYVSNNVTELAKKCMQAYPKIIKRRPNIINIKHTYGPNLKVKSLQRVNLMKHQKDCYILPMK